MKTTISDIARLANVSAMTVSRVINGTGPVKKETAERIRRIIKELNYHPNLIARSLSSKRTMMIGVIIPKTEHLFLDNYLAQILSGISDILQENNYRLILYPVEKNSAEQQEYLNIARSNLLDGLILIKVTPADNRLNPLFESGFPAIAVNFKLENASCNFVDSENIRGARLAVRYLYEKGHRKIGFMTGFMEEVNAQDRYSGFMEEMKKLGLPVNENWIVTGDFDQHKAYEAAGDILKLSKRPTALFCSDDYMAIGAMRRFKEAGLRIPEDIALVGFDDIELAAFVKPALTTVRQPMFKMGETAARIVLDIIRKKLKPPVQRFMPVELIERESV